MDREHTTQTGTSTDDRAGQSTTVGDRRWPGATQEELLSRRTPHTGRCRATQTGIAATDPVTPELSTLAEDPYLLEPRADAPRERRRAVLDTVHALALDAALSRGGDVVWVDVQGHATTYALSRIAPSDRALDRVHVARAFTPHQHHTLLSDLRGWLAGDAPSPFGTPATDRPAIVVCPAVDALYRGADLPDPRARRRLLRAVAVLTGIARDHERPVLLTRTREDDLSAPVERAATTIDLRQTDHGPRLDCEDLTFETLTYPVDGGLVQTTLAFWRAVLETRHGDREPGVTTDDDPATTPASPDGPAPTATRLDGRW